MAPNTETLPYPIVLPLSHLLPSLQSYPVLASVMLYTGDVLACLGLAGMLSGRTARGGGPIRGGCCWPAPGSSR